MPDLDSSRAPLKEQLAQQILKKQNEIRDWYREKARLAPPPFYSSVDLRNAGFKISAVDTNLYPAGFNNICDEDIEALIPTLRESLTSKAPTKRILLIPEKNDKNGFYIENLEVLLRLLSRAGFEARLGWVDFKSEAPVPLKSQSGNTLEAHPLKLEGDRIKAGDFDADLLILNNDFSAGYPPELDQTSQEILPSHRLGWHTRKKDRNFENYNRLALEFCHLIDMDPWTLQVLTKKVEPVDFGASQGIDAVQEAISEILKETKKKYEEYEVGFEPRVFIKNNSGTYGMGIHVVSDPSEVQELNRRVKNKMSVGKNRSEIGSVIVQEAVPTDTRFEELPAEPVIYLLGCELVGGFLRANREKGTSENLNSRGMLLKKLCMSDLETQLQTGVDPAAPERGRLLELVYGSIARLAALAAGQEQKTIV